MPTPAFYVPTLHMRTTDTAVTAGGSVAGWVSGTIASLAASASATMIFDLGPNWDQYPYVTVTVNPQGSSSGLTALQVFGSRTTTDTDVERLNFAYATSFAGQSVAPTTANGVQSGIYRPAGRYVIVKATNADGTNAQGASASVAVTAHTA